MGESLGNKLLLVGYSPKGTHIFPVKVETGWYANLFGTWGAKCLWTNSDSQVLPYCVSISNLNSNTAHMLLLVLNHWIMAPGCNPTQVLSCCTFGCYRLCFGYGAIDLGPGSNSSGGSSCHRDPGMLWISEHRSPKRPPKHPSKSSKVWIHLVFLYHCCVVGRSREESKSVFLFEK